MTSPSSKKTPPISPSAPPRPGLWEPLAQKAYRLRIILLGLPFLLAMVENGRHPLPLWALAYGIFHGQLPLSPLGRRLLMLPALVLYGAGFFMRLSATATLGARAVWRASFDDGDFHEEGLFGIVRHPIYLGSGLMILSLALVSSPQGAGLLIGIDIPLLILFAWLEERHLAVLHPEYNGYRKHIPALFPRGTFPISSLKAAITILRRGGGRALRSEAANAALLGGFLSFWITPDLRFFWGSAVLALAVAITAPTWETFFRGSP
ncbi:MAG: methyltransferase [Nitrospiraceae bacterium]|nr:methyltransferase [Nitrospiraceae bacterium]